MLQGCHIDAAQEIGGRVERLHPYVFPKLRSLKAQKLRTLNPKPETLTLSPHPLNPNEHWQEQLDKDKELLRQNTDMLQRRVPWFGAL